VFILFIYFFIWKKIIIKLFSLKWIKFATWSNISGTQDVQKPTLGVFPRNSISWFLLNKCNVLTRKRMTAHVRIYLAVNFSQLKVASILEEEEAGQETAYLIFTTLFQKFILHNSTFMKSCEVLLYVCFLLLLLMFWFVLLFIIYLFYAGSPWRAGITLGFYWETT
jgi:hypothetical protein